jgi:hypothetical protein
MIALRARRRPELEMLEDKVLLTSHVPHVGHGVAALVAPGPTATPTEFLELNGTFRGTYVHHDNRPPDVGTVFDLFGSGRVTHLGLTAVTGHIHTIGNVAQGHARGTLFLADDRGTVTLRVVGPEQDNGPAGLPDVFHFSIVGGTGAFKNVTDRGTATLVIIPAHHSDPDHGQFTLVLTSDRPPSS